MESITIVGENESDEDIDRISALSNSILGQILFFLPTKNAASTLILSTRWRNLFPSFVPLIKLDLDDSLFLHPQENEPNSSSSTFTDFVDKLLFQTLKGVPFVQSMRLKLTKSYDDAKILSWVSAALTFNVIQLDLNLSLNDSETLFHILNGHITMVCLILFVDCKLSLPDNFTLPNLKILLLSRLSFDDKSSINELIAGCPSLVFITLWDCDLRHLKCLSIRAPMVDTLRIDECWNGSRCELLLDTPNLRDLHCHDWAATGYNLCNLKSLIMAHIDVGASKEQLDELDEDVEEGGWFVHVGIAKFVIACSNTTSLYLGGCSIQALHYSSAQLPIFPHLRSLSLGRLGNNGWALLSCLLQIAPNLQKLTFEEEFIENEGTYEIFELSARSPPICLESLLKEVEFRHFYGKEDEMKLLKYFLENGKVLEKAIIICFSIMEISVVRELLSLPSPSKIQLFSRNKVD